MTRVSDPARPGTWSLYVGNPRPLSQIADQVRSSTGATYGRKARYLPPGWQGGKVWRVDPKRRSS